MNLITYEDKVALNENSQIPDVNKVTADDMNQIKNAINNLFPIGFIISVDNAEFDPNTSLGGTWERLKGKIIIGVDEDDPNFATSGLTGGEKEHTLTVDEMPSHYHKTKAGTNVQNATNGDAYIVGYGGAFGDGGSRITQSTGGGQPHNNMPPYYTAYKWIKTAM